MKKILLDLFKGIITDPKVIKEVLLFIKKLLSEGKSREETIGATINRFNLPKDIVTKIVDYFLSRLD